MKIISTKNEIKKFGLYTAFFTVSFSIMQAVLGTHYENDTCLLYTSDAADE